MAAEPSADAAGETLTPYQHATSAPPGAGGPNGYVFLCRNATQVECIEQKLFALSEKELERMSETIVDTTQLFLLNMNSGALVGVFKPVGKPGLNLNPDAFDGGNFAAQVRVEAESTIHAVRLEQRMAAGPKTAEQVVGLRKILDDAVESGTERDPLAIMEDDMSYGNSFPRGKGLRGKGKGKQGMFWAFMAAKGFGKGGKGGNKNYEIDDSGGILGQFTGTIKSFGQGKGYGFIECAEIAAMGKGDVYFHGSQSGTCKEGDTATFVVFLTKEGRAQAKDLVAATTM